MFKSLIGSIDIAFGHSVVYGMMTATGEVSERAIIGDLASKRAGRRMEKEKKLSLLCTLWGLCIQVSG